MQNSSRTVDSRAKSILIERRDSHNVCVAFSSRETPAGKFTFYKVLRDLNANLIFANDYSNQWFLNGPPGYADETKFTAWLRYQVDQLLDGGKLYMIGASMGAYAALKYGAIMGADRIIAMGPESELCLPLGRSVTSLSRDRAGSGDITGLSYKNPKDVLVVSGSNDIVDVYCAASLHTASPDLNVKLVLNQGHVVAKYLGEVFDLSEVVPTFFSSGDASFLDAVETFAPPTVNEATALKIFNESLAAKKVDVSRAKALRVVADKHPYWSFAQHFYALVCEATRNLPDAEAYLNRALAAQPDLGRSRLKLAQILARQERWDEAVSLLELFPDERRTETVLEILSRARVAMAKEII